MPQTIEVERQSIGRDPEFGCDFTGRHTFRSRLNQQPIRVQSALLSERRKLTRTRILQRQTCP